MPHSSPLPEDKQVVRFERGFKTWSENTALQFRKNLRIANVNALPPRLLAEHLGVKVWNICDVPGLPSDTSEYLGSPEGDEWSAMTIRVGKTDVVVVNSTHSPGRQASDLAHEMAHIVRGHEPSKMYISDDLGVSLRAYNALQEAEANWLAGCLLLPRPALAYCVARGMDRSAMQDHFGVSEELLRYRLNITGVTKQFVKTT